MTWINSISSPAFNLLMYLSFRMKTLGRFVITKEKSSLSSNSVWIIWKKIWSFQIYLNKKKGPTEFRTFITLVSSSPGSTDYFSPNIFLKASLSFCAWDVIKELILWLNLSCHSYCQIYFCFFLFGLVKIKTTTWFTTFFFTWCWIWSRWSCRR